MRIGTEAACRTAAAAAVKTPASPFVVTHSGYPRSCYYVTSTNNAFFNTDAVGAGRSGYQLLCAALVITGAPPPKFAREWTARCSRAVCVIMLQMAGIEIRAHTYIDRHIHTYVHE